MKVFLIVSDLGVGGQERQLTYLAKGLARKGVDVKIIIWNNNQDDFYIDVIRRLNIGTVSLQSKNIISKIVEVRRIVKSETPDVLQSFSFYLNAAVWLSCISTATKAWGTIRSRLELKRKNTGLLLFWASTIFPLRFISNNRSYAEGNLNKWIRRFLSKRCKVIGNAISFESFLKSDPIEEAVDLKTVSVSRIDDNKRIDLLIKVHKSLKEEGFNVTHLHAGDGEPELKEKLQNLIDQYNLNNSFHFLGNVKDVAKLLDESDLFLHAADYEGNSNVIMEAMIMGLPVVSTDCGDTRFNLTNNKGGFVTPVGTADEMITKASQLLHDKELRLKMGTFNHNKAKEEFSIDSMVEKYLEAYNDPAY